MGKLQSAEALFNAELAKAEAKHCSSGDLCLIGQIPHPESVKRETKPAKPIRHVSEVPSLATPSPPTLDVTVPIAQSPQAYDQPFVYGETRLSTPGWLKQHDILSERAQDTTPNLVMMGASITKFAEAGWLKREFGKGAEAFGIGADNAKNLLWRVRNGEGNFAREPEKGVLLIGANSIVKDHDKHEINPTAQVVRDIVANVDELTKRNPHTKWLVVGVLPQGFQANDWKRAPIEAVNVQLAGALKGRPNVHFVDIGKQLLSPDGRIIKSASGWMDWIHPQPAQLLKKIHPYVDAM